MFFFLSTRTTFPCFPASADTVVLAMISTKSPRAMRHCLMGAMGARGAFLRARSIQKLRERLSAAMLAGAAMARAVGPPRL